MYFYLKRWAGTATHWFSWNCQSKFSFEKYEVTCLKLRQGFHMRCQQLSRDTAFPTRLHVRSANTQISLRIRTGWSHCSMSAWRRYGFMANHRVPCEDSDQTARMRRLIWVFAWRNMQSCRKCCAPAQLIMFCIAYNACCLTMLIRLESLFYRGQQQKGIWFDASFLKRGYTY